MRGWELVNSAHCKHIIQMHSVPIGSGHCELNAFEGIFYIIDTQMIISRVNARSSVCPNKAILKASTDWNHWHRLLIIIWMGPISVIAT